MFDESETVKAKKRDLEAQLAEEGQRLRAEARQREEPTFQVGDVTIQPLDQDGNPVGEEVKLGTLAAVDGDRQAASDLVDFLGTPDPMPEDWRDNMRGQDARLTGGNTGDLIVGAMSDGSVQLRDEEGNGGWLLGPFQAIETGQQLINMATKILLAQAQSSGGIAPVTYQKPRIFTGVPRKGGQ